MRRVTERSVLQTSPSDACIALRETGILIKPYGLSEETTKSEDFQTQAPQAHEGESPQKAFALQVVIAPPLFSLGRYAAAPLPCQVAGTRIWPPTFDLRRTAVAWFA